MPATFERDGDAIHLVFRCDGCGAYAGFGEDVHLREAIAKRDPRLAGKWWCGRNPATGAGYCKREPVEAGRQDLFGSAA